MAVAKTSRNGGAMKDREVEGLERVCISLYRNFHSLLTVSLRLESTMGRWSNTVANLSL